MATTSVSNTGLQQPANSVSIDRPKDLLQNGKESPATTEERINSTALESIGEAVKWVGNAAVKIGELGFFTISCGLVAETLGKFYGSSYLTQAIVSTGLIVSGRLLALSGRISTGEVSVSFHNPDSQPKVDKQKV